MLTIVQRIDDFAEYSPEIRDRLFRIGKQEMDLSGGDIIKMNGALLYMAKSGDKRGIAIAQKYLDHPHWSVRKVAKQMIINLSGKG